MSRSKLGLKSYSEAKKYAEQAIKILSRTDEKEVRFSNDIELAKAYVARADAFSAMNKYDKAIVSYEIAEGIYKNAYTDQVKEMHEIAYTTFAGAKAACYKKDAFWYKHFYTSFSSLVNQKDTRIKELENLCSNFIIKN